MTDTYGPDLGLFATVTPDGQIDPEGDDPWTIEYLRTFYDFVRWRETAVAGVGEIYSLGTTASGFLEEYRAKGESILIVEALPPNDGLDHYVDIPAQRMRPKTPSTVALASTSQGAVLRGLPAGAVIVIDWGEAHPTGGDSEVALTFDQPGAYRVEVKAPTQLSAVFEVNWP